MESAIAELRDQERTGDNAFAAFNHLELSELEEDRCVFRLDVRDESKNPFGFVHGGLLAGMADNAAGYAAHTDGRTYVTQSSHLNYIHNQVGGVVWAEGRVLHRGRTVCLVRADIRGEDGTLLATGELSYFCVDPDALERKAAEAHK